MNFHFKNAGAKILLFPKARLLNKAKNEKGEMPCLS